MISETENGQLDLEEFLAPLLVVIFSPLGQTDVSETAFPELLLLVLKAMALAKHDRYFKADDGPRLKHLLSPISKKTIVASLCSYS